MSGLMIFIIIVVGIIFTYAAIVNLAKEITIQKLCEGKTTEEIKQIIIQYTVLENNRNRKQ